MKTRVTYLLKRLLQSLLVVVLLTIITFSLSLNSPTDPVDVWLGRGDDIGTKGNAEQQWQQKKRIRQQLGYNLPVFYLQLCPATFPANYYLINDPSLRSLFKEACYDGFSGRVLLPYFRQFEEQVLYNKNLAQNREIQIAIQQFGIYKKFTEHEAFLTHIEKLVGEEEKTGIHNLIEMLHTAYMQKSRWKQFVPTLHFYPNNQYHIWLFGNGNERKGIIRGDFGLSVQNKKTVWSRIAKALPVTLLLSALSIGISLLLGIISGLVLGYFQHKSWTSIFNSFLFLLYTIPSFWLATLLLVYFANPQYFNWFPPGGLRPANDYLHSNGIGWSSVPFLVLPVLTLAYHSYAVLTRMVRKGTEEAMDSLYIFSARARGLSEPRILFKHAARNVLLPVITVTASILPALFSGSVVVETIFAIPGMGQELLKASLKNDINVVMAIFTISAVLSVLGYLISDILYTVFDPRIKLHRL
ncbi:ABC transporter permease subunit [bacterium]|nr:ABC transporter permease subunit [bacterium]